MAASPRNSRRNLLSLDLMGSQISLSGLSQFFPTATINQPNSNNHNNNNNSSSTADSVMKHSNLVSPDRTSLSSPTSTKENNSDASTATCSTNSSSRRMTRLLDCDTAQEEKRQDMDSSSADNCCDGVRSSPRSPIAILKLSRTRLFSDNEGSNYSGNNRNRKPTNPITVTYSHVDERDELSLSSQHTLASSMFLVTPLRPLAPRRRAPSTDSKSANFNDFKASLKASLIDSSKSILRPLTPRRPTHRYKRSMSDMHLVVEESKEAAEYDNELFMSHHNSNNYNNQYTQAKLQQQPTPISAQTTKETATAQPQPKSRWLIPAEHPYKVLWDVITFMLSFANVYATHASIRDRQYGTSWLVTFCEAWFMVDILLNFITEYRSDNYALRDCRSVWARYLTTWFLIDVFSLFPGEALYLKPLIEVQNRRGFFEKNFVRSKAVVRVTRILRGRHFKLFGQATKHTKHAGIGASRLLRLLIKYIPKYLLFFRNMKGVVAVRLLRQVHWFRKVWRNFIYKGLENNNTIGNSPDANANSLAAEQQQHLLLRKNRSDYDENDDGAPF